MFFAIHNQRIQKSVYNGPTTKSSRSFFAFIVFLRGTVGTFRLLIVDVSRSHEIFWCARLRGTSAGGSIRNSNRFVTSDRR